MFCWQASTDCESTPHIFSQPLTGTVCNWLASDLSNSFWLSAAVRGADGQSDSCDVVTWVHRTKYRTSYCTCCYICMLLTTMYTLCTCIRIYSRALCSCGPVISHPNNNTTVERCHTHNSQNLLMGYTTETRRQRFNCIHLEIARRCLTYTVFSHLHSLINCCTCLNMIHHVLVKWHKYASCPAQPAHVATFWHSHASNLKHFDTSASTSAHMLAQTLTHAHRIAHTHTHAHTHTLCMEHLSLGKSQVETQSTWQM